MHRFFKQGGALTCAALSTSLIPAEATEPVLQLEEYIASAGPGLRSIAEYASPVTILDGTDLSRGSSGSLGAALNGQPGVTASSFAAGASRPILRGFDGPRVRVVQSGIESLDASDTSPDHGVAVEPLLTERVEILRGPSTLLYGSSAIGGVVNVIGREIPRQPGTGRAEGAVEFRHDSVSDGETALGYARIGNDRWALALTGLKRDNGDYEIPGHAEAHSDEADAEGDERHEHEHDDKLIHSFVRTGLFSVGASWFFTDDNFIGFAYSDYTSLYGVPGHHGHDEDHSHGDADDAPEAAGVSIDLNRRRYESELQLAAPVSGIDALRVRFGYTDYAHTELEGDATGTLFEREGWELRAEAAHAPALIFNKGIVGLQLNDTDFSAVGAEAFTPASTTRSQALFVSEHIHRGPLQFEVGGRIERQSVSAEVDASDYRDVALSIAAGVIWEINDTDSLALALQRSQRHPTSTELFADGPHLATRQYEIGAPDLNVETAYGVDLTWRSKHDRREASLSVFYTFFNDYVFAEHRGFAIEGLPAFQFTQVDAVFSGIEGEVEFILYRSADAEVRLGFMGDFVQTENRDSGDHLPRIPPLRLGSRFGWSHGSWEASAEIRYAFKQNNTAPEASATDGYTELNLDISRRLTTPGGMTWTLFARASNLLDEEIRHHTSFLKDAAPLPGRNFTLGGRWEF